MKELAQKGQGIQLSGVSAQFQNGFSENCIKIVTNKARAMMIHASLHWPEVYDKSLWPLAISHATYLYNHTPDKESGISPAEIFTGSKSDHSQLMNLHPWGCPAFVLEPRLREGKKIPKWDPRSRKGIYLGMSPLHADSVALVMSMSTGAIFHHSFMLYLMTGLKPLDYNPPPSLPTGKICVSTNA